MRGLKTCLVVSLVATILLMPVVFATTDTVGGTNNGLGDWTNACAVPITATASGTLRTIGFNLDYGSCNAIVGLYSNSGGPATLLSSSAGTAISAAGWNDLPIGGVSIVTGTKYWMGLSFSAGCHFLIQQPAQGGPLVNGTYQLLHDYDGTLPNPWSGGEQRDWAVNMRMAYGTVTTTTTTAPPTTTTTTLLGCPAPSYPSAYWQRVWYVHSTGACLGETPNEPNTQFDTDWGSGVVAYGRVDDTEFRSSRTINLPATGTYTFTLGSDDGARLWIDGNLMIDRWADQPYSTSSASPTLTAGNHQFRLDYYESSVDARVSFSYVAPPTTITTTTTLPPTSIWIPPGRLATVKFLTPLSRGTHTFRLCTPSACQTGYLTIA